VPRRHVLGWIASGCGGRFGAGVPDPRGSRGRLPQGALPGHGALAEWLDPPVDRDAEFAADLHDLEQLVVSVAGGRLTPPEPPREA
jgi:hypothetical protein